MSISSDSPDGKGKPGGRPTGICWPPGNTGPLAGVAAPAGGIKGPKLPVGMLAAGWAELAVLAAVDTAAAMRKYYKCDDE